MTPPPLPDSDDEGNPLALPDPKSEIGQMIYLLEWARLRGFRLGPILQIGETIIQVSDLRQREGRRDPDDKPDRGPWDAAGYTEG